METITQRLSLLRGAKTQKEFANFLGVEQTYISRYELGKVKPTTEFLTILVTKTGVSINWLLTGEGEMYLKSDKANSDLVKENTELKREVERINNAIVSQVADLQSIVYAAKKSAVIKDTKKKK